MIAIDTELYSSPYYFLLRDKGNKYSLYFSVETTLTEARRKDEKIDFDKKHGDKVRKRLSKIAKEKKAKSIKWSLKHPYIKYLIFSPQAPNPVFRF